jgi:hypothetical protein
MPGINNLGRSVRPHLGGQEGTSSMFSSGKLIAYAIVALGIYLAYWGWKKAT